MNAKRKLACAAPTLLKWKVLKWPKHEAVVKKLQVRIAKAVKEKDLESESFAMSTKKLLVSSKRCGLLISWAVCAERCKYGS